MNVSTEPPLNALAVAFAAIMTGLATVSEYLPAIPGALSSIGGLLLVVYMLVHRRMQIKIDKVTLRKVTAEAELAERALDEE